MSIESYTLIALLSSALAIYVNRKHPHNLYCVFVVLIAQWTYAAFLIGQESAAVYYGMAALLDTIAFRCLQNKTTDMALALQLILFGSLLSQSFGYVTYQLGIPPTQYNNIIQTLAGMQTAIMLWGDGGIGKHIGNSVHDMLARSRNSMGIFKT